MTTSAKIELHKMCSADIPGLVRICREAFPQSARWRSRLASRLWWQRFEHLGAAEVWVADCDGETSGFMVLVREDERTAESHEAQDCMVRIASVVSALCHPSILKAMLLKRLRQVGYRPGSAAVGTIPDVPERLWLELIAVSPGFQGRGVARQMLNVAECRAASLQRRAIRLLVDEENHSARRLYESCGYVCNGSHLGHSTYTRIIHGGG